MPTVGPQVFKYGFGFEVNYTNIYSCLSIQGWECWSCWMQLGRVERARVENAGGGVLGTTEGRVGNGQGASREQCT